MLASCDLKTCLQNFQEKLQKKFQKKQAKLAKN